jgi:hypothetical protein
MTCISVYCFFLSFFDDALRIVMFFYYQTERLKRKERVGPDYGLSQHLHC